MTPEFLAGLLIAFFCCSIVYGFIRLGLHLFSRWPR